MNENSKVKTFIGRNPTISALKTKFLDVLGSSTEVLNGISNKLTLIISSSGSDGYDEAEEEERLKYEEGIDYTKIDFESRRMKARRAHEEIISRRYRQPNLIKRSQQGSRTKTAQCQDSLGSSSGSGGGREGAAVVLSTSSTSTSSRRRHQDPQRSRSLVSSSTRSNSLESRHSGGYKRTRPIPGARRSELDLQRDMKRLNELIKHKNSSSATDMAVRAEASSTSAHIPVNTTPTAKVAGRCGGKTSNSSTATSLPDELEDQVISTSLESTDWCHFIRSESENSVPSWASSISLDVEVEVPSTRDFMCHLVEKLFEKPKLLAIDDVKMEFGVSVRGVWGRKCFIHFLLKRIQRDKCVNESTFCLLVKFFTIILYECKESDDFMPASILMNLCFLIYKEIEVPGCDPYREYMFTFLRAHPLWCWEQFWRVAFAESLRQMQKNTLKEIKDAAKTDHQEVTTPIKTSPEVDDKVFKQLAAFTSNIHALGAPQSLCHDFFTEQAINCKINEDQIKLIFDNIKRMYNETDQWGEAASCPPRL